ncbi:MAG TPA: hypothetical protein EYH26_03870 [Pyrodictium sp.]|nr:hypothetical protein [Pyrodictium sp.]HIQ11096.1 hypothetical protein [Pyrodictium sp.]HIQ55666.1 hypothetical protein [Pyrodictium sp.]
MMHDGARRVLALAIMQAFFATSGFSLLRPSIAAKLRYELDAPAHFVTGFGSLLLLGRTLGSLIGGMYIVNVTRCFESIAQPLSALAISLIIYCYSLLQSPTIILALAFFQGFAAGLMWPLLQSIVAVSAGSKRAAYLTLYTSLGGLGLVNGYVLYTMIGEDVGFKIVVASALYGITSLVAFVGLIWGYRSSCIPREQRKARIAFRGTVSLVFFSLMYGLLAGIGAEYSYLVIWEVVGLEKNLLGVIYAVADLTAAGIGLLIARLAKRYSEESLILTGLTVMFFASLISFIDRFLAIVGLGIYIAMVSALLGVARSYSVKLGGEQNVSGALALSNAASGIGVSLMEAIAGFIYVELQSLSPEGPLMLYSTMSLLLIAVVMVCRKSYKSF